MNKLQTYLKHKKDPQLESFRMLWDMQEKMPQIIKEAVANIEKSVAEKLQKLAEDEMNTAMEALPEIVNTKLLEIVNKVKKGEDGYTPVRGKDYFNAEDEKILSEFILANIPEPINGKDGKDADEKKIEENILKRIPKPKDGEDGKDGSPDSPEDIKKKVLSLEKPWLPKEAIIGLEKMFMSLQKKDAGGGGMGAPQHEVFNINAGTTSVQTAFPISAGGNAIFKATYQGQELDKDVHYTVGSDRRTISFVSTTSDQFSNSTFFSMTYIRG